MMTDLTETHYHHSPVCIEQDMGEELLLFNPSTTEAVCLNGTARIVWALCENNCVEALIHGLQEQYPDQSDAIPKDVYAVVDDLVKKAVLIPCKNSK
jgi:hypothetical protein